MSARSYFLSGFGAIYSMAFASFYLQQPGLLGDDGLLPAAAHWRRIVSSSATDDGGVFLKVPSLLWLLGPDDNVDVMLECVALVGIALSALVVGGVVQHGVIFLVLFLSYLTLFISGQTWLSFQWDLFLLETGAMSVLYAPWTSLNARTEDRESVLCGYRFVHPMSWVLRVQWVKFMVMSGAVKVQAQCPTWKELTALEYHLASTCLPTSEAWLMHSLHPFFLRCGVAFMFLCELVAPWLLLAPVTRVRRIGVAIQVPLQLGIMLTGNYNWFNLHTMVLLLPAWESDVAIAPRGGGGGAGGGGDDDVAAGGGGRNGRRRVLLLSLLPAAAAAARLRLLFLSTLAIHCRRSGPQRRWRGRRGGDASSLRLRR